MRTAVALLVGVTLALAGCVATSVPPEEAGLASTGPYPGPGDVCVSVTASAETRRVTSAKEGLIACPANERGALADREREGFNRAGPIGGWVLLQKAPVSTGPLLPPPTKGVEHLIGQTVVFFDEGHGTQVAYFEDFAREHLWYPGNQRALLGFWRTTPAGEICFRYPNSGINPVTGVAGPDWECASLASHKARIVESTKGDVFGLASGRIPFVMEGRTAYRLDDLRRGP